MFQALWFKVQLLFAGIFPQVEDIVLLSLAILICIIAEFAAGWLEASVPLLTKPLVWIQKNILYIAICLSCVVLGEWRGAHSEAAKWEARGTLIEKHVDKVTNDANGNKATRKDKFESDQ